MIRNNIFAFSTRGQIQRNRAEPHLSFAFVRNIVYWTEGFLLYGNWSDEQIFLDHNLYFDAAGQSVNFAELKGPIGPPDSTLTFAQWQARGHDQHSRIADPLFVDATKHNFTLKPGSPALKMGFRPIDLQGVGPRE